jgi:hypothetical protein
LYLDLAKWELLVECESFKRECVCKRVHCLALGKAMIFITRTLYGAKLSRRRI